MSGGWREVAVGERYWRLDPHVECRDSRRRYSALTRTRLYASVLVAVSVVVISERRLSSVMYECVI